MSFSVIKKEMIDEMLTLSSEQGKRLLEPLKTFSSKEGLPINVLEDTNVSNDAEVHRHEADLWLCLSGEVTFICGGELVQGTPRTLKDGTVDEREWKAKEIKGGKETVLKAGDWLHISAGVPHQHRATGTAKLVIIKIPTSL